MGAFVIVLSTGLLVIAFASYLLVGALHEFGEAGGGEALGVAGPVAAVLYALTCSWLYLRGPRPGAVGGDLPATTA